MEQDKTLPKHVTILNTESCRNKESKEWKSIQKRIESDDNFTLSDEEKLVKSNGFTNCVKRWRNRGMPPCWTTGFLPYIKKQALHGKSIIVSNEVLSFNMDYISKREQKLNARHQFWKDFAKSLQPDYNILIIMTYRNYFDWIYSWYVERNEHFDRPKLRSFKGSRTIPSPEMYYRNANSNRMRYFPHALLQQFSKKQKISTKVLNMDHTTDMKREFFCNGLPSSLGLCHNIAELKKDKNISPDYLCYDILATNAHNRNLTTSNNRREVFKEIKQRQEEKGLSCQDFPQACPSDDFYNKLFNFSMNIHYKIFPNDNKTIEVFYKEKFQKSKLKFCSVNATAVLMQDEWRNFLKGL